MFAGQIHPAFIQALMVYVWCSPEAPQAGVLNTMLADYLQTLDSALAQFRASWGNLQSSAWTSVAAGCASMGIQMTLSPGYARLSPTPPPTIFYHHWLLSAHPRIPQLQPGPLLPLCPLASSVCLVY